MKAPFVQVLSFMRSFIMLLCIVYQSTFGDLAAHMHLEYIYNIYFEMSCMFERNQAEVKS